MISKLALKSSLLGSVGSGAYISTIIDIPDKVNDKPLSTKITDKQKKNFSTLDPKNVTLEVVEMWEKEANCRLIFTDNFGKNKNYTARRWFEEKMKENSGKEGTWKSMFASGLVYEKKHCKWGETLILELRNGSFKPKQL